MVLFCSLSLTYNSSEKPTDPVSKNYPQSTHFSLPSLSPLSLTCLSLFPMLVSPGETLTMIFLEHKLEHLISLLKNPPSSTHYRERKKKKKKPCHILPRPSGLRLLFGLHISTDYIIYHNLLGLRHWVSFVFVFVFLMSSLLLPLV